MCSYSFCFFFFGDKNIPSLPVSFAVMRNSLSNSSLRKCLGLLYSSDDFQPTFKKRDREKEQKSMRETRISLSAANRSVK